LTAVESRCGVPKETYIRKERRIYKKRTFTNYEFDTGVGALSMVENRYGVPKETYILKERLINIKRNLYIL